MAKKDIARLTVPGNQGYHPQIAGSNPVSRGTADDKQDVTAWVIDQLSDIHQRCRDLINN
jgi:hypothetical protein